MNLPKFGSLAQKGCKVLALSAMLAVCAACGGGSEPEETANAPVSSEVEISQSATPSEAEGEAAPAESGATEEVAMAEGSEVTEAGEASVGEGTGDGTTETVDPAIERAKKAVAEAEKQANKKPERAPVKRKAIVRDPFRNLLVTGSVQDRLAAMTAAERAAFLRSQAKLAEAKKAKAKQAAKKQAVKIVKPKISVNGIVRGGAGYSAMISDGKQTRLVSVGDRVDKYRILGIDPYAKTVTIGLGTKHKFLYSLEKESFGAEKRRS